MKHLRGECELYYQRSHALSLSRQSRRPLSVALGCCDHGRSCSEVRVVSVGTPRARTTGTHKNTRPVHLHPGCSGAVCDFWHISEKSRGPTALGRATFSGRRMIYPGGVSDFSTRRQEVNTLHFIGTYHLLGETFLPGHPRMR